MVDWSPDIKRYPHFDWDLKPAEIISLVTNTDRVKTNSFYPFLRYQQGWQPYRDVEGGKPDKKDRPIRFASRRDAYIFAYYRHLLVPPYEDALRARAVDSSVLAYRKLVDASGAGKSNIEFARDAFLKVRELGSCGVVALDIKSFFESLDHEHLAKKWKGLLDVEELPGDHRAVFRAVTQYRVVERDAAYERLGHSERKIVHGRERLVPKTKFGEMPRKLCSNREFREKICGSTGKFSNLVEKNPNDFGIPQGSPISDLLANLYMIDFDSAMVKECGDVGGTYYRYSDDILLVVPGGASHAAAILEIAQRALAHQAPRLTFKPAKTSVHVFERDGDNQKFERIEGELGRNGLEYLGFRYDGRCIRVRDATVSGLYRKVTAGLRAECAALVARYPGKDHAFLLEKFDFPGFLERHGRVEDFSPDKDYDNWTFWTYAKRAMARFGPLGRTMARQLRNYKRIVRERVSKDLADRLQPAVRSSGA